MSLNWIEKISPNLPSNFTFSNIPDSFPEADEAIISKSTFSGRPFKITSEEIKRYRKFNVPLPRLTYDERMENRALECGDVRLHKTNCSKTGRELLTAFSSDDNIIWDKLVFDSEFY